MDRRQAGQILTALAATAFTVAMVVYPEIAFAAAVRGLRLWWDVVFPALLPFFIGGQVLMGLGAVHFAGVLLEPLMRPLFNLVWLVTRGLHPALRELGPAWAAAAGEYEAGFAVRLVLATQWLAWTLGCVALVAAATAMVASWSRRRPPRRWIAFYVRRG